MYRMDSLNLTSEGRGLRRALMSKCATDSTKPMVQLVQDLTDLLDIHKHLERNWRLSVIYKL